MSITKEELMNQVFDAGLITLGAVGISMVSKKAMGDPQRSKHRHKDSKNESSDSQWNHAYSIPSKTKTHSRRSI